MADPNQPAIKLFKAPPTTPRWHRHARPAPAPAPTAPPTGAPGDGAPRG